MTDEKKNIRKTTKAKVATLTSTEKLAQAEKVWNLLEGNEHFCNAETIMLFWSLDDEISTHEFIEKWYKKKKILLPIVNGDDMTLCKYDGIESMHVGAFNILEPSGEQFENTKEIDLVIVPGVAFTIDGKRMGRGRGYYDRFLSQVDVYKIGVCFNEQIVEEVPCNSWDIPMNEVVYPQKDSL